MVDRVNQLPVMRYRNSVGPTSPEIYIQNSLPFPSIGSSLALLITIQLHRKTISASSISRVRQRL
jgi:hypothetical protein